jgi:hypothetical protein
MDDSYWSAVRTTRLRIADLLESLTPYEWNAESLCPGWRVRDVAGHLALVPAITTWDMVKVAPRAGFNPNRINTLLAIRHGSRDPRRDRRRDPPRSRRTAHREGARHPQQPLRRDRAQPGHRAAPAP